MAEYRSAQTDQLPEDVFDEAVDPSMEISWKASEYIHHHKSATWFIVFSVIAFGLTAGLFFILRDISVIILSVIMSATLFTFANRKPNTLDYIINNLGISIGDSHFGYEDFRSFSIMDSDGILSIELSPLQRFRPTVSIYFDPNDGEKIVDILGSFLPAEQKAPDLVDRLIRFIRF